LNRCRPGLRLVGVEPVEQLRHIGHANGLAVSELVDGDATHLSFDDGTFDVVCAFGVLHHVRSPERVVGAMLRVARKGVFLSDSNNVGQGAWAVRAVKQMLNAFGVWPTSSRPGGEGIPCPRRMAWRIPTPCSTTTGRCVRPAGASTW
jgi:SAM-dependent methyltransferase